MGRNTRMKAIFTLPGWIFLLALGGCADMVRERIYHPPAERTEPIQWRGETPRSVRAMSEDGIDLHGLYWPPTKGVAELLIFFPGNSDDVYGAAQMAEPLRDARHGVLVASYRGFGENAGRPSEKGLMLDGAAFVRRARELAPGAKLYLFGYSLGASVALRTAVDSHPAAVVTLGAFTRLSSLAPAIAGLILPDRFDNVAAIARVEAPILIIHGTADETVPFEQADRLRRSALGQAYMLAVVDGAHRVDLGPLSPTIWRILSSHVSHAIPVAH